MAAGGMKTAVLVMGVILGCSLLVLYPVCGDNPSYTECRPHIDATIRNLAAKAIVAGEVPPSTLSSDDYEGVTVSEGPAQDVPPVESSEVSPEQKPEVSSEPAEPPAPEESPPPEEVPSPSVPEEPPVVAEKFAKRKESRVTEAAEPEDLSTDEVKDEGPAAEEPVEAPAAKVVEAPAAKVVEAPAAKVVEAPAAKVVEAPAAKVVEAPAAKVVEAPAAKVVEAPAAKVVEAPAAKVVEAPAAKVSAAGEETQAGALPKQAAQKQAVPKKEVEPVGIFEKFVNIVFGLSPHERDDKKWAQPWQTHEEFKKKPAEKPVEVKVDRSKGGLIHSFVNIFFGESKAYVRDPKWAEPWQTHKEHKKQPKKEPEPVKKVEATGGIFNKFVDIIFGEQPKEEARDAKWSQPWQTHKEHQKKAKDEPVKEKKERVVSSGGIIDSFVSLIFAPAPEETKRDPKWSQPWQTHPEFSKKAEKKVEKKEEKEKVRVDTSGGLIDSFVQLIFPTTPADSKRDPKWSQPWQTHPEFSKKAEKKVEKKEEKEKVRVDTSGGLIDSFVQLIFPTTPADTKRDPKWSQPWQTHPEFSKKAEKKVEKKEEKEKVRVDTSGGLIDSFVQLIFPTTPADTKRDPKWAQPWQTHKEFSKAPPSKLQPVKDKDVPEVVPKPEPAAVPKPEAVRVPVVEPKPAVEEPTVAEATFPAEEVAGEDAVLSDTDDEGEDQAEESDEESDEDEVDTDEDDDDDDGEEEGTDEDEEISDEVDDEDKDQDEDDTDEEVAEAVKDDEEDEEDSDEESPEVVKDDAEDTDDEDDEDDEEDDEDSDEESPEVVKDDAEDTDDEDDEDDEDDDEDSDEESPEVVKDDAEDTDDEDDEDDEDDDRIVAADAEKTAKKASILKKRGITKSEVKRARKTGVKDQPDDDDESSDERETAEDEADEAGDESDGDQDEADDESTSPQPRGAGAAPAAAPAGTQPVADAPEAAEQQVLVEESAAPQVPQAAPALEEEEEQIVVVPTAFRSRDRLEAILGLDESSQDAAARTDPIADATLKELKKIYESTIKPLEVLYKYKDISNRHVSDAELFGTPLILLVGPYSTGKSSFINYLLGVEYTKRALKTGTPPSHGVFRVVQFGEQDTELDGTDLSAHWSFTSLQKFGQNFIDQLHGKAFNSPLLKKVTFVEAPGILEMRRPGERLYPFNDVAQWFIDRADLILVMFDHTKLDAGYELEAILDQLKGREAQTRILLNKADQVPAEELIKVQGSLFWNLSPLLGVSTPPTVYAGSFASRPYRTSSPARLFQAQEEALLTDIALAVNSRVDNRIAIARRHAVRVRNHAQMVDTYLTTYYKNKGFLTSKHKLAEDIVENPHTYNIYEGVGLLTNISRYDLPDPETYRDFFRVHNLFDFQTLKETCSFFRGCPLTKIDAAISTDLPELLERYRRLLEAAIAAPGPKRRDAAPVPAPSTRGSVPAAATARTS